MDRIISTEEFHLMSLIRLPAKQNYLKEISVNLRFEYQSEKRSV